MPRGQHFAARLWLAKTLFAYNFNRIESCRLEGKYDNSHA
jgi:hypothetical protein